MSEQADATGNSMGVAIGHLALKRGLISPEQLRDALVEQSKSGLPGGTQRPLDSVLIALGYLTRDQLEHLHTLRETRAVPGNPGAVPETAPSAVGKYRVVREAGRGAMAKVYEAFDTELERKVALKMLISSPNAHPEEATMEEQRFLREARVMANLPKHPNIVGVYDAGLFEGRRYLAMEYVDGQSMEKWWNKGSLTVGRPTTLLRDVALAVHHAHEHGVIHRDLKPANILVDADNQPHVMDFGLAKLVGQSLKASYTEGGLAVGTPAYMSPEQATGVKTVDRRTDVYSMGVMLYEILTGKLPFNGDTPMEVMVKTSKDPVVPPSKVTSVQINPVHFKTLEAVCLKALAKDPANRYSTAGEFAEDLTRWLRGQDFKVSDPKLRRRVLAGAAIVLLLASGGLLALRLWKNSIDADLAQADHLLAEGKIELALGIYSGVEGRDADNPRAIAGRRAALEKLREKLAPPPPPPPPPDPWKSAIQLLPSVDLSQDMLSGKWHREEDGLVCTTGSPGRVQIPYHPPEEYDVRIAFLRRKQNYCVNLILSKSGQPFTLVMEKTGTFGYERVRGQDFGQNSSFRRIGRVLEEDRVFTVIVEVRNDGLKAWCEGEPISELKSFAGLTMNPDWALRDPEAFGVGAWSGGATIRRLEIREVTGKGQLLR